MENTLQAAVANLAAVAGKRKKRMLSAADLLKAIEEARNKGWSIKTGSRVGKSYQYLAYRMRLVVARLLDGDFTYFVYIVGANPGASTPDNQKTRWREEVERYGGLKELPLGWYRILKRDTAISLSMWAGGKVHGIRGWWGKLD